MSTPVVTRFAPSPTGYLHLGNARTALLNYLAARKLGGRFILRVEDTDEARSEEGYLTSLLADLRWLGLQWEEGPDVGGERGPYRQSDRHRIYQEWLAKLDSAGLTYPCFCTPAELSISRRMQISAGAPPRYAGTCRNLSEVQRAERRARGLQPAIRYRVPTGRTIAFDDVVHGEQRFLSDDIGDFVIRRADGSAAFFFSNAIDDALMDVTLVLRGDDHLTNTPRQLMLLESFGFPAPRYAHVALLLGMDGAPLSKRHGATSLHELRERGFLPEALRNHLVRLGHACARDGWLDDTAMLEDFNLERLGRAAAKFDEVQLRHWQKEAVARLSTARLREWLADQLPPGLDHEDAIAFCESLRHNIERPADARPWVQVVFGDLDGLSEDARAAMRDAGAGFYSAAVSAHDRQGNDLKLLTRELSQATGRKGPALYMPLRAALTGSTHGPELGPLLRLMGGGKVKARLQAAERAAA